MIISYAVLTHNEGEYIKQLIEFLITHKRSEDEIVIVDDFSTDELTKEILNKYKDQIELQKLVKDYIKKKNFSKKEM
jgi:glycosyltransferase involved in cell wall biosynthesis